MSDEVERVTKTYHTTERMGHIMSHESRESALARARAFPGRIVAYETTQIKRRISAPLEEES